MHIALEEKSLTKQILQMRVVGIAVQYFKEYMQFSTYIFIIEVLKFTLVQTVSIVINEQNLVVILRKILKRSSFFKHTHIHLQWVPVTEVEEYETAWSTFNFYLGQWRLYKAKINENSKFIKCDKRFLINFKISRCVKMVNVIQNTFGSLRLSFQQMLNVFHAVSFY